METTKKHSPFTHANRDFWTNLMLLDFSKAEAYRKNITAPQKGARNLRLEKLADIKVKEALAKSPNLVSEYAKKNSLSEPEAYIAIVDGIKADIYKQAGEIQYNKWSTEIKSEILAVKEDTKTPELAWNSAEKAPETQTKVDEVQTITAPVTTAPDADQNDGSGDLTPYNPDATGDETGNTAEDPKINYDDLTKAELIEKILAIDPIAPVSDKQKKDELIQVYKDLIA